MIKKPIYGVGINDADYAIRHCLYYRAWLGVLTRCFNPKYQKTHPTYQGCTVCEEWLTFSAFKKWMEGQDWQGNQLDKDLLKKGNKHYCPELCCFIPQSINLLFNDNGKKGNLYGVGVTKTAYGKYVAKLNRHPKKIHLGTFITAEEAQYAYYVAKAKSLQEVANNFEGKIRQGLLHHAGHYLKSCL